MRRTSKIFWPRKMSPSFVSACCILLIAVSRSFLNNARSIFGKRMDLGTTLGLNVYCPECPPGGTIGHLGGHPGGQQKKVLPFGHGRGQIAFNGTGL